MRVRVLVFHPAFTKLGGAELNAIAQARCLNDAGADCGILTLGCEGAWQDRLNDLRVEVVEAVSSAAALRRVVPLAWAPTAARLGTAMEGSLAVIAHNYPASVLLGLAEYTGARIWYCNEPLRWLHPVSTNPGLLRAAQRDLARARWQLGAVYARWLAHATLLRVVGNQQAIDRRAIDRLDAVWADSEFARSRVIATYGRRQVDVVYPIVNFRGGTHRAGIDRSGLHVLCVARLDPAKNVDNLLRGFALFRGQTCAGASLQVVGEGPCRQQLERLSRRLGQFGHVVFHGHRSDVQVDDLASRCDAFALAPFDEPFGMVFPEAAGRGLLVLGPNQGGPEEILEGGRLGVSVDPASPEAIAGGLERLWSLSDATADDLRARSAASCRARFGQEAVGAKMVKLLRGLGVAVTPSA